MANTIPRWVQERYSVLWKEFKDKEMAYEDIKNTLTADDKNSIGVFLNELRLAGWIRIELSQNDLRKRTYLLKRPELAFEEIKTYGTKRH